MGSLDGDNPREGGLSPIEVNSLGFDLFRFISFSPSTSTSFLLRFI
jgi:hypothetical protein